MTARSLYLGARHPTCQDMRWTALIAGSLTCLSWVGVLRKRLRLR